MFGFVVGTVCLVALVGMLKRHHRWAHGGCHGRHGDGYRGGGRGFFLRHVYRTLDTTPGQEKVIAKAVAEMEAAASTARGELQLSRRDLARAMAGESFDAEILGNAFARHDEVMDGLRRAATGALAQVHDALDEKQRARVAELLDSGPGMSGWGHHFGGPYR